MSIRSTINQYRRYINSLEQGAKKLKSQYDNMNRLLNELQKHDYSGDEFYGRNYEDYLAMIQDSSVSINNRMQIQLEESLESIESRVEYLWRRIDALEEKLNKD